ncbi:hypothetical protein DNK08_03595 [Stutzerimonas kirkiae]|nr:hypothetical protein DNK08_03595 [Stutzerimonas kirkiae]
MHDVDQTIEQIKHLISQGGGSSQWFAQAFLSWLSYDTRHLIDLSEIGRLDNRNFDLLVKMLRLRRDQQLADSDMENLIALRDFTLNRWGN